MPLAFSSRIPMGRGITQFFVRYKKVLNQDFFGRFSFNHQISHGWFQYHDVCNGKDLPGTG
jgi:hypothetical protein